MKIQWRKVKELLARELIEAFCCSTRALEGLTWSWDGETLDVQNVKLNITSDIQLELRDVYLLWREPYEKYLTSVIFKLRQEFANKDITVSRLDLPIQWFNLLGSKVTEWRGFSVRCGSPPRIYTDSEYSIFREFKL